ncbi:MAG: DinB family protein [Planctomycetota bacterium]|jgi:uncharacterized damage-inducible protein DinB
MEASFFDDALWTFRWYKDLAERAMAQLDDAQLQAAPDAEANSVAVIVKHMAGNMRSRWTDFLTTDGEKPDRHRDTEFEEPPATRAGLLELWENGWASVFDALEPLGTGDVTRTVTIRGREHTVMQAVHRQLTHYAYHVGQIVYVARMLKGPEDWKTLSIARGASGDYVPGERL